MNETLIGVISKAQAKWKAVHDALPGYSTVWIAAPRFEEPNLIHGLHHDFWRSHQIAEGKAEQDFAAFNYNSGIGSGLLEMIRRFAAGIELSEQRTYLAIYNDTVRFLPGVGILEKPVSQQHWFEQMMLQRGQEIWVCSSNRMRRINGHTVERAVDISTRVQAKDYGRDDVLAFGHRNGIANLMHCSGGMPIELAAGNLLDEQKPLEVFVHASEDDLAGRRILSVPDWAKMTPGAMLPYYTGAINSVLVPLIEELQ